MATARLLALLAPLLLASPGCVVFSCVDQLTHVSYPEQTAWVVSSHRADGKLTIEVAVEETGGPGRARHTVVVDAAGVAGPFELRETTHAAMRILLGDALFGEPWPRYHRISGQDADGIPHVVEDVPALREEPGAGARVAFYCLAPFAVLLDVALFPIELPLQLLMFL